MIVRSFSGAVRAGSDRKISSGSRPGRL